MNLKKALMFGAAVLSLGTASVVRSEAATLTVAYFSGGSNTFDKIGNFFFGTGTSNFSFAPAAEMNAAPFGLFLTGSVPYDTTIRTNFFIDGEVDGAVNVSGGQAHQNIKNISYKFVVSSANSVGNLTAWGLNAGDVLFQGGLGYVADNTAFINADLGKQTASVRGDNVGGAQVINFESPFTNKPLMSFPNRALSWSLNGANPKFGVGGGQINDFRSTITGQFTVSDVPEPGAVAMLVGLGVTGSLFVVRRRK